MSEHVFVRHMAAKVLPHRAVPGRSAHAPCRYRWPPSSPSHCRGASSFIGHCRKISSFPSRCRETLSPPRYSRKASSISTLSAHEALSKWPKCANPTPYEVLDHPPAAPYTKDQFRRLVKLYHPDLHSSILGITPATRIERYHLIVKAHDILSDPAKRRAYDACGAHWGAAKRPLSDNERYEAWKKGPYASCANNGTWEDWERWYDEQANGGTKKNEGYYMSNGAFVTLVVSAVSILAVMQSVQTENQHAAMRKKMQKEQEKLGVSLTRSQDELRGLGREERIERFLRHRENMAYGFGPANYGQDEPSDAPSERK